MVESQVVTFVPGVEAQRLARRYRLAARWQPRGGPAGDRLGRGVGASMEFHDRRRYAPGDDVRHIDWRALARTDEMFVRVHREEVTPRVDLFVDVSRSMSADGGKGQRSLDLVGFLALAGRAAGQDVRVVAAGTRAERVDHDRLFATGLALEADRPLADVLREAAALARAGSLRIVVSDFLFPHDPEALVRTLAQGAGRVALVQLLSRDDADPAADGALRLTDAESGATSNVILDARTIARYRDRLARLTAGLDEACRRSGGELLRTRSDLELDDALAAMAREGVLE